MIRTIENKEEDSRFHFIVNTEEPKLLQSLAIDDFYVNL